MSKLIISHFTVFVTLFINLWYFIKDQQEYGLLVSCGVFVGIYLLTTRIVSVKVCFNTVLMAIAGGLLSHILFNTAFIMVLNYAR